MCPFEILERQVFEIGGIIRLGLPLGCGSSNWRGRRALEIRRGAPEVAAFSRPTVEDEYVVGDDV
jgi:hypothetical protein